MRLLRQPSNVAFVDDQLLQEKAYVVVPDGHEDLGSEASVAISNEFRPARGPPLLWHFLSQLSIAGQHLLVVNGTNLTTSQTRSIGVLNKSTSQLKVKVRSMPRILTVSFSEKTFLMKLSME